MRVAYETYQMKLTLRWCCEGNGERGYGDTPEEAYEKWLHLVRYDLPHPISR